MTASVSCQEGQKVTHDYTITRLHDYPILAFLPRSRVRRYDPNPNPI